MDQAPTRGVAHEMRPPRSIDKLKSSSGNSNIPYYQPMPYYGNHNGAGNDNDEDLNRYHSAKELQVNISHETAATEPESDNEEDEGSMYVSLGRNNSNDTGDTDDNDGHNIKPRYSEKKQRKQRYIPQRQFIKSFRPSVVVDDQEEVEVELESISAYSYCYSNDEASEPSALTTTPVRSHQKGQGQFMNAGSAEKGTVFEEAYGRTVPGALEPPARCADADTLEEESVGNFATEADDDDQVSVSSSVARLKSRFEKDAARDAAFAKLRTLDPPIRKTTVQVQECDDLPRAMPATTAVLHSQGTCPTVPEVEAVYYPQVDAGFGDVVEMEYHTMGSTHAANAPHDWKRSHYKQDPPEMMMSMKKVESYGSSTSVSTVSITDSSDDSGYLEQQQQQQHQAGVTNPPFVSPYQPPLYPAAAFAGHPYQLQYPHVAALAGYPYQQPHYPTAAAFVGHPYQQPQYPPAPAVAGRGDHHLGFDQPFGSIDFPQAGTKAADPNPFVQWANESQEKEPAKCKDEWVDVQPPLNESAEKNSNVKVWNGQPSDSPPHVRRITWEDDLMGGSASQKSMAVIKEDADDMLRKYFSTPQFVPSGKFDDGFSTPFDDQFFSSSENPFKDTKQKLQNPDTKQSLQNPGETPDRTCCDFEDDGFFSQFPNPFKEEPQKLQDQQGETPVRTTTCCDFVSNGTNDNVDKDDQPITGESKPSPRGVMEDLFKGELQKFQDEGETPVGTAFCDLVSYGTNNVAEDDQLNTDESKPSPHGLTEAPVKVEPEKKQDQGETPVQTTTLCDIVSYSTNNVAKDDQLSTDESKPSPHGVMEGPVKVEPEKKQDQGETPVRTSCCDFVQYGSNVLLAKDGQLNTEEPEPSSRGDMEETHGLNKAKNGDPQPEDQKAIPDEATADQKSAQVDEFLSQTMDASQKSAADWIAKHMNLGWNVSSMLQKKEACDTIGKMESKDQEGSTKAEKDKEKTTAADDSSTSFEQSFEQMFARLSVFAGYLQKTVAKDNASEDDKQESSSLPFCSATDVLPTKSFFESSSEENVTPDDCTTVSFGGNSLYSSSLFAAGDSKKAEKAHNKVSGPEVKGSSWRPSVRGKVAAAAAPPGTDRLGSINDTL